MADDNLNVNPGADGQGTPGQPAGQPAQPPQGGQPASPAPGTPAPAQNQPGQSGDDRRQAGILADLQKERRARQQYEQQVQQYQAELDAERRRVAALAGVSPKSPEETEVEEIRARFGQVFPALAKLNEEQIERLLAVAEQADTLDQTSRHYWESHGRFMVNSVEAEIAKELGGQALKPSQLAAIRSAYIFRAQQDPEFASRHEEGDPNLIKEFAQEWISDWFEPVRRKATATELNRQRPVPGGRDRSIVARGGQPVDFNNPKAVADAMVESFKQHGGSFGD